MSKKSDLEKYVSDSLTTIEDLANGWYEGAGVKFAPEHVATAREIAQQFVDTFGDNDSISSSFGIAPLSNGVIFIEWEYSTDKSVSIDIGYTKDVADDPSLFDSVSIIAVSYDDLSDPVDMDMTCYYYTDSIKAFRMAQEIATGTIILVPKNN